MPSQVLKQLEWLTGVTMMNHLWMIKLLNQLGKPKLMEDNGKASVIKDERDESDWGDRDEGETNE